MTGSSQVALRPCVRISTVIVTAHTPSVRPDRLVKESGEVVEESVSRDEQRRLMATKATHVPSIGPSGPPRAVKGPPAAPTASGSFTGREKFPSQHPWFGYK